MDNQHVSSHFRLAFTCTIILWPPTYKCGQHLAIRQYGWCVLNSPLFLPVSWTPASQGAGIYVVSALLAEHGHLTSAILWHRLNECTLTDKQWWPCALIPFPDLLLKRYLYIGNLPPTATSQALQELFPDAKRLAVITNEDGLPKGYCSFQRGDHIFRLIFSVFAVAT